MKKDYMDFSWLNENTWGKFGADDEVGMANEINAQSVMNAFSLVKKGKVYDLGTEMFKGMNIWNGHCGFEIVGYASAYGSERLKNTDGDDSVNWYKKGNWMDEEHNYPEYHMGCNTEMVVAPMHIGTHIDALCHWSTGEDNHWYNGYNDAKNGSGFGPTKCDVTKIPPLVMRGVLLDIAGYKGLDHLPGDYIITAEDCEGCAAWQNVELKPGDAVLLRVGETWPEGRCGSAGLGISAARYLVEECGAILIGDDMSCLDGQHADGSTSVEGHPQPVHHYLLIQRGVHILEYVQLEEIAKDKAYEFLFICAPAKIRYATGMFCRPLAIV